MYGNQQNYGPPQGQNPQGGMMMQQGMVQRAQGKKVWQTSFLSIFYLKSFSSSDDVSAAPNESAKYESNATSSAATTK